jgi:hypothetical protein
VTSEAGARRSRSISNIGLLCQTRKTPTFVLRFSAFYRIVSANLQLRHKQGHMTSAVTTTGLVTPPFKSLWCGRTIQLTRNPAGNLKSNSHVMDMLYCSSCNYATIAHCSYILGVGTHTYIGLYGILWILYGLFFRIFALDSTTAVHCTVI